MKIKKTVIIFGIILLIFATVLGISALNQKRLENRREEGKAKLFILPEEGTFIVDEDFIATVNVDTNREINAAGVKIYFPVYKLEIVSLSKKESIFELWAVEPSYSNTDGTIWFSGGLPSPGFKGSRGKILTITFKAIKEGRANIRFGEGLVLANDGRGTDILKELKSASYALIGPTSSDLNDDGYIDTSDLDILLSNWGIPENSKADINKDGQVDIVDFSILLLNLGQ